MSRGKRTVTKFPGVYVRTKSSGERVYDISYWLKDGVRRRRIFESGFPSLKAARERRQEIVVSLRQGVHVAPNSVTLGEYTRRRLDQRFAVRAIRESTYWGDLALMDRHLPEGLSVLPIQHLTTAHLNDLYARLASSGRKDGKPGGLSARTIERLHVLLGQTLKEAMSEGVVHRNVATAAKRPRRVKKSVAAMTAEEVRAFLRAAEGDWFYALYFLAITTGMRRGELCGLTWDAVDLETGELVVNKAVVAVNHQPVWSGAKTDVGNRTLSLDKRTVEVLREHRRRVAEARLLQGTGWRDEYDLVFPLPDGSLFNPERIYMRLSRLLKKAGLGPYSVHALRHTYATLARRQGMDIKVLSDRLGHSTVGITMDLYQHVPQDVAKKAASDVAAYILGGR